MYIEISTFVFTALIGVTIIFHLLLLFGMPWGEATMGGKYKGKLPMKMRIVSFISILILLLFAIIVSVEANILWSHFKSYSEIGIWFVVGYSALGIVMNTITPSKIERKIWVPVTVLLFVSSLIVALAE